ncbi:sulfite exporter TauE/SafE family protein [Leptospira idonii]|uniref:sulfite exporter TauE/SafE family protein n=1 Tax=Leptospira idonii TaxID=1193500 RepID=UPI0024832C5C|nr:sulfite exporter TauE/SafE family protein [Leptospira idonii]
MDFSIFHEFSLGFYPGIFAVLLVGFFVGYLASFLGIGGGFVYTPFFHSFFHLSAVQAVAVSLAQMPLSALSGLIVYFKNDKVRWREGLLLLVTSIPSAQYIAWKFGRFEDTELGRTIYYGMPVSELVYLFVFTVFLGILGIYNLLSAFRKRKQWYLQKDLPPEEKTAKRSYNPDLIFSLRPILVVLATGVAFGLFSSILGIGGGFLAVPLFVYYFKMEPVEAVATSFLGIFITSFGTSVLFYLEGKLHLDLALVGTIGGFFGARVGSLKAVQTRPYTILMVLGSSQLIVVSWYILGKLLRL